LVLAKGSTTKKKGTFKTGAVMTRPTNRRRTHGFVLEEGSKGKKIRTSKNQTPTPNYLRRKTVS